MFSFGVGDLASTCVSPVEVFGGSVLVAHGSRRWFCGGSVLILIRILCLVFNVWLGSISPYSLELGFVCVMGLCLWCLSQGRIGLVLVYLCCRLVDKHSLHVAWYVWDMVPSRVFVFLAVVFEVVSILSGLFDICSLWKEAFDWLEFGLFKLMVSVTVVGVRYYVPPVVCLPMF